MTFVCEYKCDRCGRRAPGDLTPEGWRLEGGLEGDDGGEDVCNRCVKAEPRRTSVKESDSHE